ncbi:MAG TPA: alanine racemase, partial [Rugosimonospora sp.]|nr:alanine racemase [Rugosimonospora sp.]
MTGPDRLRARYEQATADLDPPFGLVDLDAFDANAAALAARAAGTPLRVASKSVRCRYLLRRVLATPGWSGVMSFSLPEAVWLVQDGMSEDVLVAYPTTHRAALKTLGTDPRLAAGITLMVDSLEQLDYIDAAVPPEQREVLRLCIDLDASWRLVGGRLHVGVRRSPIHGPEQAGRLARAIRERRGYRLVGLMSYEAQIAGLGDAPPGQALRGA